MTFRKFLFPRDDIVGLVAAIGLVAWLTFVVGSGFADWLYYDALWTFIGLTGFSIVLGVASLVGCFYCAGRAHLHEGMWHWRSIYAFCLSAVLILTCVVAHEQAHAGWTAGFILKMGLTVLVLGYTVENVSKCLVWCKRRCMS